MNDQEQKKVSSLYWEKCATGYGKLDMGLNVAHKPDYDKLVSLEAKIEVLKRIHPDTIIEDVLEHEGKVVKWNYSNSVLQMKYQSELHQLAKELGLQ